MDNQPFVESFRSINASYLKLIDSLSALRALSTMSTNFSSDEQLLGGALSVLVENQDMERCCIYLVQEQQLVNVAGVDWDDMISVHNGLPRKSHSRSVFALGEGMIGLAAQSGRLQHCRDCQNDSRFSVRPEATLSLEEGCEVVGSLICVPISNGDQVLGVLNVSHPHANFFDDGHERSLRIFSNVLGQMLVNNRLLHQMDAQVKERTRQLHQALEDAEELRHRYETLSTIDDLTQLHNRRFFFPESRAALARCVRTKQAFTLLMLDVDHFKSINDNFGHAAGDQVLRDVAELIKQQLREGDIVARFGGEEFVVALPDTDGEGGMILAERIRKVIKQQRWPLDGHSLAVTVSIGISDIAVHEERDSQKLLDRLIMEADQALYFGKHHGRDQCQSHAAIACKL
jgi:diguanylate cyclase (GGDEF)-like protein